MLSRIVFGTAALLAFGWARAESFAVNVVDQDGNPAKVGGIEAWRISDNKRLARKSFAASAVFELEAGQVYRFRLEQSGMSWESEDVTAGDPDWSYSFTAANVTLTVVDSGSFPVVAALAVDGVYGFSTAWSGVRKVLLFPGEYVYLAQRDGVFWAADPAQVLESFGPEGKAASAGDFTFVASRAKVELSNTNGQELPGATSVVAQLPQARGSGNWGSTRFFQIFPASLRYTAGKYGGDWQGKQVQVAETSRTGTEVRAAGGDYRFVACAFQVGLTTNGGTAASNWSLTLHNGGQDFGIGSVWNNPKEASLLPGSYTFTAAYSGLTWTSPLQTVVEVDAPADTSACAPGSYSFVARDFIVRVRNRDGSPVRRTTVSLYKGSRLLQTKTVWGGEVGFVVLPTTHLYAEAARLSPNPSEKTAISPMFVILPGDADEPGAGGVDLIVP